MRIGVRAVAVMAIVVAATGCSDGGEKEASPSEMTRFPPVRQVTPEPISEGSGACGLLTQAEIQAAVGQPVNAGSGSRTEANESCTWRFRNSTSQFVGVLTTTLGAEAYAERAAAARAEPLPGVGDGAFVLNDAVYALKGERLIIVQVTTNQPVPARKDLAVRLVQLAVPRG